MKNKHRTRSEVLALLSDWKRSGLSLHAFTKSKSLVYGTMLRWKNRFLPPSSEAKASQLLPCDESQTVHSFVPVEVLRNEAASPEVVIEVPSGVKLRVSDTIAPDSLRQLLRVLREF